MLKNKYPFLAEMLCTASPSGDEVQLQKKWMAYISEAVDCVETDVVGNVYGIYNNDAAFKVLLAGHADEIAFVVQYIDSNGYIYLNKAGGINPKVALGARVNILGDNGPVPGVVGHAPEHFNVKKEITLQDIYIDIGATSKEEAINHVNIGDYVIYQYEYVDLMNDRISGRGLDNRTGSFIVGEVLKRLDRTKLSPKVGVYGVSTVNEETNMGGAHFAAERVRPTIGIACDVTFSIDQPDSNPKKNGEVSLGKGPVLSMGAPIHKIINKQLKEVASAKEIPLQFELTPKHTGTDADKIRTSTGGVPVALISLPLRYMHSPSEVADLKDIEFEIELILNWLYSLTGEEDYKLI